MGDYTELEKALNRPYATMRFVRVGVGVGKVHENELFMYGLNLDLDPKPTAVFRGLFEVEGRGYPQVEIAFDPGISESELVGLADWIAKDAADIIESLAAQA